jgi:hypothetical protein
MPVQNAINRSLLSIPIGSPEGLRLIRSPAVPTVGISFTAGRAVVITPTGRVIAVNTSTMMKRLDLAWAAGDGNGGLFANNTRNSSSTYHAFIICNLTTGAVDFGFDANPAGSNAPSGWSARIIGSLITNSSSEFWPFIQHGNEFNFSTSHLNYNTSNASIDTANLITLTVPNSIRVRAIFIMDHVHATAAIDVYTGSPEAAAAVAKGRSNANQLVRTPIEVLTDVNRQVRFFVSSANATTAVYCQGYIHGRGEWG